MNEPILHKLIKIPFKFNNNITLKRFNFKIEKADRGKCFRTCATVWSPATNPPYDETNWYSKICVVVIFGFKIFSFDAVNK